MPEEKVFEYIIFTFIELYWFRFLFDSNRSPALRFNRMMLPDVPVIETVGFLTNKVDDGIVT